MNAQDTQGHQSSPLSYILLVAQSSDSEVIDLIDEFRQLGWGAVHAESPEMVAQAPQVAAVVVALAPSIENTPIFTAVMRIDPPCLIPVKTKPTPTPDGPWACAPIPLRAPLSQVAHQILDVVSLCSSEE
jgi:hypothetical protein